jgi:hypothetical protein
MPASAAATKVSFRLTAKGANERPLSPLEGSSG